MIFPYGSWKLHEYSALPTTAKKTWTVKTSSQVEKRFVALTFQTDRKNNLQKRAVHCEFGHCNETNGKLFPNEKYYLVIT